MRVVHGAHPEGGTWCGDDPGGNGVTSLTAQVTCNACAAAIIARDRAEALNDDIQAQGVLPQRRRRGWVGLLAAVGLALTILASTCSVVGQAVAYRQMRALEGISERCGR